MIQQIFKANAMEEEKHFFLQNPQQYKAPSNNDQNSQNAWGPTPTISTVKQIQKHQENLRNFEVIHIILTKISAKVPFLCIFRIFLSLKIMNLPYLKCLMEKMIQGNIKKNIV